jgi:hypothetical protein
VWDPERDSGTEKPATEAIEVDVPDGDAPETPMEAPPVAWTAEDQSAGGAPATEPAASGVEVSPETAVDTGEPEPALVEAAAAGAVAQQQAAEPRPRRWGRDKSVASDDETKPNAPVVVFFILLGIVFAFVFIVAAVTTVTQINDLRQARGQAPDADLSVYLRAIGDTTGFGVMAVLCWVGAGIIGRLD